MSLQIPPEIEEMVQSIFSSGQYESESEVIREALGLLRRRDLMRRDINEGIAEIDRGERIGADEVFQELEKKAAQLTKVNQ
jgi:antitoxin ParD1/3/4